MITHIFTYRDGASKSFESHQFQTIDDAETFYFGHSLSDEIVYQTSDGGVSIPCKDVVEIILREFNDQGLPIHYREYDFKVDGHVFVTKYNGSATKQYQVYEWINNNIREISHPHEITESGAIVAIEEDGSETTILGSSYNESTTDQTNVDEKQSDVQSSDTNKEKETVVMDENQTTDAGLDAGTNKIQQKFVSFREKYTNSENEQNNWENQIIEKMIRREKKLKEMSDLLDKENEFLDRFKEDKLGV